MREELKQEIVILVTEHDFKRHNPKIEVDEMRLINFTERLMFIVQNRLDGIGERYHTCVSMEPGRPAKSPWIKITPETMPEDGQFVLVAASGTNITGFGKWNADGEYLEGQNGPIYLTYISHYQPITLPKEN